MAAPRRRVNGEGSVYRLKNGRWRAQYEPPSAPGQPRRRRVRNAATKTEALQALADLKSESRATIPSRSTLNAFLAAWLDGLPEDLSRATRDQYSRAVNKHLLPGLGFIRLDKLGPLPLTEFFRDLAVGDRTRQVCYDVLRAALNHAVDMELIPRSPLTKVRRPKWDEEEIQPFLAEEALRLIEETRGDRWHAAIVLGLTVGLRQAELFGLEKRDICLKSGTLRVRQNATDVSGRVLIGKPKTDSSDRTLLLPEVAVSAVRSHLAIQLQEGLASSPMLLTSRQGQLARRGNFRTRFWNPLLVRLGLEHRGAHHLRHTFATLALGAGVPVHVVAQILGHASATTTLEKYAHAIRPQQAEAMARIQGVLGHARTA